MVTAKPTGNIVIQAVETETIRVGIRGVRPLINHRLAQKARQELLMPVGRRSTAERASSLKHDPIEEFRASPYRIRDEQAPTLIGIPASAFKGAMMTAALRLPGAKKTEIGQLLWVEGDLVPVYGVPELFMAITRSADMARTPDVRTRAIMAEWATEIEITFTKPILNQTSILNLLTAAGRICGVGDWRPEKGKGTYGQFVLTHVEEDPLWQRIAAEGGRDVQVAALANPTAYDEESEELLGWFEDEVSARGKISQLKRDAA